MDDSGDDDHALGQLFIRQYNFLYFCFEEAVSYGFLSILDADMDYVSRLCTL